MSAPLSRSAIPPFLQKRKKGGGAPPGGAPIDRKNRGPTLAVEWARSVNSVTGNGFAIYLLLKREEGEETLRTSGAERGADSASNATISPLHRRKKKETKDAYRSRRHVNPLVAGLLRRKEVRKA